MSSKLFGDVIQQTSDAIGRMVGVIDQNASVIACSDAGKNGVTIEEIPLDSLSGREVFAHDGYTYKPFSLNPKPEYSVFVEGLDDIAVKFATTLAVCFENMKLYYDEKYDRANFIKNVILDNILPGDIYIKAKELNFAPNGRLAALLIRVNTVNDVSIIDVVRNLFPDKSKDFVININQTDIALIKEVHEGIKSRDLEKLAASIVDTLGAEFYTSAVVGIGTIVTDLKELARSFKEAQISLEVSKVFDTERPIVSYDNLGIARLIYQLPTTLCEMFLKEVFKSGSIDSLDHETLFTIQKFFENSLNVSETSRKLFVHRNTLVYRLEKIKKITGLDLREFDHAIVFKVALMVKKYLSSNPVKY